MGLKSLLKITKYGKKKKGFRVNNYVKIIYIYIVRKNNKNKNYSEKMLSITIMP